MEATGVVMPQVEQAVSLVPRLVKLIHDGFKRNAERKREGIQRDAAWGRYTALFESMLASYEMVSAVMPTDADLGMRLKWNNLAGRVSGEQKAFFEVGHSLVFSNACAYFVLFTVVRARSSNFRPVERLQNSG